MCSAALYGFWTNFGLHIFVWVSSVFSFKIYFTCTRGVEELLIPSSLLVQMDKTRIHSYTAFPFVWAVLIKKSWITFYNMITYVIQHIIHPGPGCLQVPEGILSQLGLEFQTKATSSSLTNNMLYISTTQSNSGRGPTLSTGSQIFFYSRDQLQLILGNGPWF